MRPIHRYGREIDSVFDLLGRDENSLTFALGWCLSRVPALLDEVAAVLGRPAPGPEAAVYLQDDPVALMGSGRACRPLRAPFTRCADTPAFPAPAFG